MSLLIAVLVGALVLYAIKVHLSRKNAPGPLPPGPPGKPIVGNIADLPPSGEQDWMHWLKHKTEYGKCAVRGIAISTRSNRRINVYRPDQLDYRHGTDDCDCQ